MSTPSIRVIVVEDHPATLAGLKLFIQSLPDLILLGTAATGEEAIALCEQLHPDVVLMDMKLPGMGGLAALRTIKERQPEINVIPLTGYSESDLVERAIQAGASGYLMKTITESELADAIRSAYHGRTVLAQEAAESLMEALRGQATPGIELTHREKEVLALLKQGLSNAQIASRLNITPTTVKFHVRGILTKLKASSRAEAVTMAWQRNLLA
jgi:NarL family two-component system response regulator LiaR